jgi:hypothetical protein
MRPYGHGPVNCTSEPDESVITTVPMSLASTEASNSIMAFLSPTVNA